MKRLATCLVLWTFLVAAREANSAAFQGLGYLPGSLGSVALDVTSDGSTIVGYGSSANSDNEAFRWTEEGGRNGLGFLPVPGSEQRTIANAVSADGSVVVGLGRCITAMGSYEEAFRWTETEGMVGLGDLTSVPMLPTRSKATDVSSDGSVVVGQARGDDGNVAFRWTEAGGMVGLGEPNGIANGVSADGSVVVGYGDTGSLDYEAFRWTESGGIVGLGYPAGGFTSSYACDLSSDGSVVVGYAATSDGRYEAFRWTAQTGIVPLGNPPADSPASFASAVSPDGSIILGDASFGSDTDREAFIWDESNGFRNIQDLLSNDFGLDLTGWTLEHAYGISSNGTIVGGGKNPSGDYEAWMAAIPELFSNVKYWTNPTGGAFASPSNWQGVVPDTDDTAAFDLSSAYTVTFDSNVTNDRLLIKTDNVTLDLDGFTYELTGTQAILPSMTVGDEPGTTAVLNVSNGSLTGEYVTLGQLGGSSGTVHVPSGATLVTSSGSSLLIVGDSGTGTLNIDGGMVSTGPGGGAIAQELGSAGTVTLSGAGATWTNAGSLYVGGSETAVGGAGQVTVHAGTSVDVGGLLRVWDGGTVQLDGGSLAASTLELAGGSIQWTSGALNIGPGGLNVDAGSSFTVDSAKNVSLPAGLTIGDSAVGTLVVSGGGSITSANGFIGKQSSGAGSVTLTGDSSTWSITGSLYVGGSESAAGGAGELIVDPGATVEVGGTLKVWDAGSVQLNRGTISVGSLETSADSFQFNAGTLRMNSDVVIRSGEVLDEIGALNLTSGKHLSVTGTATLITNVVIDGGTFSVGSLVGSELLKFNSGTLEFTGPGFTVGSGGPLGGALTVRDGQHFNGTASAAVAADGFVEVQRGSFSAGTLTNDGEIQLTTAMSMLGGGTLVNNGLVRGRGRISASLDNAAAGEIRGEADQRMLFTAGGGVNHGAINLFGGTVEFSQDLTNASDGIVAGRGILRAKGGITNEGTMAFSSGTTDVLGDVTNAAGSRIVVSGGATATFFDDLVHDGAEIRVSDGSSAVFFGDVSGAGPFTGGGTTFFEGDLRPGNSPGTLALEGDAVIGHAGGLVIEIGGTQPGIDYDVLQVGGELALHGDLQVELLDGFMPLPGDEFTVLTFGTRSGEFVEYVGLDFDGSTMLVPQWRDHGFTLRAVPEPGGLALLVVGSVVAAVWYLGRGRASRSVALPHRRLKPSEVRRGGTSLSHNDGVS